ncbi:activating signal cointegrator 1 complex subunit 2 [Ostrinia furnacalis]|uniref:activating signal cointegrator 1 complex subunit 2 n=1 Tax=Ostrinia furnacalis TaxID=93504 RepID=UPI00103D53E5|nr:activating signal cointegrator 1 complex subunit 2 [Ostrinia furnacalis]
MSNKNVEFSNPENLPVEKLSISVKNAGVIQEIKALDKYWVEKRELTLYERPPSGSHMLLGAMDAWKLKAEAYISDLKWLLSLEHHKFWSTVLYHSQVMDALVSFLQEASPPYAPPLEGRDVQKTYAEARRLVLVVFSRLATNKESKSQWMSKEFMAETLYNNFIFTIPIVWDLCLVYGADNPRHVARLLGCVFSLQPKYEGDTAAAVAFVKEAFKYIILQVNKNYDCEGPPNLPETFKGFGEIRRPPNTKNQDKITFEVLKDLVIHLLDTAMTLRVFVEVYPKSVKILRKANFIISIVQLYEHGIPLLYEKLQEVGDPTSVTSVEVEGYIDAARAELIDIFREVLAVYKNDIFSGEGNIPLLVEEYLAVMLDGLSEKLLIKDYHACYPVHDDLELLRQACPDIDTVKTDFILQAIYSNLDEPIPESALTNGTITNGHAETTDNSPEPTRDNEIPDSVKEESLISEVKDILPHLGDGFILKCLKHYGFNAARVINSILEDNLAEPLRGIDQNLPIIPEDPVDNKYLETGINRLNVFDGDEFDIMTRDDVDLSRVHRGKKREKYKDLKDLLDDKTEVKRVADIYSKYNMVCDEQAMYSDEYDDTYDSDGVAAADAGDDTRRPFVTPRALQQSQRREAEEESEEESEPNTEQPSSSNRNKLDFCVNPEEIRARREASYNARRGRGHRPPPAKNMDVTGKPKGQGQDKDVLHNRDKKEKHKSSRGNHNRRQGAQWKRGQGLLPS